MNLVGSIVRSSLANHALGLFQSKQFSNRKPEDLHLVALAVFQWSVLLGGRKVRFVSTQRHASQLRLIEKVFI